MNHYIDIRLRPCPEFNPGFLMSALFSKLHRGLVDVGQGEVGVSFPQMQKTPGEILRLHGEESAILRLLSHPWLNGMRDHIVLCELGQVPASARYATFSRYQPSNSAERKRRRSVRKGWLTEEEALQRIPDQSREEIKLPYLMLRSNTNRHAFRLYVQRSSVSDIPVSGSFNQYGLSSTTTVPVF